MVNEKPNYNGPGFSKTDKGKKFPNSANKPRSWTIRPQTVAGGLKDEAEIAAEVTKSSQYQLRPIPVLLSVLRAKTAGSWETNKMLI